MVRVIPTVLAVALLFVGDHVVRADAILTSGIVTVRADGELGDGYSNHEAYHTVDTADIGVLSEVNATLDESIYTAGGDSAANPFAALSIAGGPGGLSILSAPVSSSSSASLNGIVSETNYGSVYAQGRADSQGSFQVTESVLFRLTIGLNAFANSYNDDAFSSAISQVVGSYWLTGGPDNLYITGTNQIESNGNSASVFSGTHYLDSVDSVNEYLSTIILTGTLLPGNYFYGSKIDYTYQNIGGYQAGGDASASQSYTLEFLTAPEPDSLTLVGLGSVGLVGARFRRRRARE